MCSDKICCCICESQIELFKHPINTIYKGSISESTNMYVCIVKTKLGNNYEGFISENEHGLCELFSPRPI